ncbi:hypothetical protein SK128_021441, partial [Halocaridina rubra]
NHKFCQISLSFAPYLAMTICNYARLNGKYPKVTKKFFVMCQKVRSCLPTSGKSQLEMMIYGNLGCPAPYRLMSVVIIVSANRYKILWPLPSGVSTVDQLPSSSTVSFSITPHTIMSSLTTSINLLFGLPFPFCLADPSSAAFSQHTPHPSSEFAKTILVSPSSPCAVPSVY